MSYKINQLGGGRKYSRVLFYNTSGTLVITLDLKSKVSNFMWKATRREQEMENGNLETDTEGHRVMFDLTVFNLNKNDGDDSNIAMLYRYCAMVDNKQMTM